MDDHVSGYYLITNIKVVVRLAHPANQYIHNESPYIKEWGNCYA